MMGPASMIYYLLLVVALVCFFAAFLRWKEGGPISVGFLGFCFWILAMILFGGGPK